MMNCDGRAAPPQSADPKSMSAVCWPVGGVGHPTIWPWPTAPENESDDTLVPHFVPVTVTLEVAEAVKAVPALGLKPAVTPTGANRWGPALSTSPRRTSRRARTADPTAHRG